MRDRLPSRAALLAAAGLIAFGLAPLGVDRGSQAHAAFPGQNGKLAFVRSLNIWVANPDGSNPTQLTTAPGLDRSPRWSPDGTRIAFASSRAGGSKMFVMNADGSDQRQLTFTSARDRTSAWSADGMQVLYDKEFSEIYATNADGSGGERKLADGLFPGTSPYGDKVAYTASAVGLITIRLDGSSRSQVTRGDADWSANWSPGGTDLVFTRPVTEADRDIFRVHANGLGIVQLTSTPSRVEVGPVWSPDGTKIAFLGCSLPLGGSDCGIYTMNRDGSGEAQVPNVSASFAEANLDWQPLPPRPQDGAPATLTVALAPRGAGVVTSTPPGLECPSVCSAEFDRGPSVRLEARPTGSLAFLGWTGACSGRSSCSVSMDGEKRVGASFGRERFKLTVSVRGPGRVISSPSGIACASRCTATFSRGVRVVLRARPARGADLVRWGGACKGSRTCALRLNADRVVTAQFRR